MLLVFAERLIASSTQNANQLIDPVPIKVDKPAILGRAMFLHPEVDRRNLYVRRFPAPADAHRKRRGLLAVAIR